MVVLGVVLVLLALAAGILLVAGVASLEGTIDVSVPGGTLSLPPLTFLVTGMVVISVFWLGWVVLRAGVRHSRRRRAEAKEAAKEAEAKRVAEEQRLKEEFAARERQLIEERRRHDSETAELKRGAAAAATGPETGARSRDGSDDGTHDTPQVGGTPSTEHDPEADATRADATRTRTADVGTDERDDTHERADAPRGEHGGDAGPDEEHGTGTGQDPRA